MADVLLELKNLTTIFPTRRGKVRAVTGLDLTLHRGEILGVVGESGSGKSVTMLSILQLVSYPGDIVAGEVRFEGRDLLRLSPSAMRSIRGKEIAMIFQDPLSTLNPAFPVGEQIRESLRIHGILNGSRLPWPFDRARRAAEKQRVLQVMEEVGIPSPMDRYKSYPHQFSGGMQQRALIAIALSCEPKILLADEPTTAVDVTIQAQILDLMRRINARHGMAIILVTHDLGVAAEFCQNILVMYAGRVMEKGPIDAVIEDPQHPYTQGLLACLPRITPERPKIRPIPGTVPDLIGLPDGCAFYPRCPEAHNACLGEEIPLKEIGPGRAVRCVLY